jgi:preprotein translocase subunit SecE
MAALPVSSFKLGGECLFGSIEMPKFSPFKFMQEVRAEVQKVTWPTRKETTVTTIMVFVMVAIASVFFLLADQVMRLVVSFVLGINT